MKKNKKISVKGTEISVFTQATSDYISLTDIAKHKDTRTGYIIQNLVTKQKYY